MAFKNALDMTHMKPKEYMDLRNFCQALFQARVVKIKEGSDDMKMMEKAIGISKKIIKLRVA